MGVPQANEGQNQEPVSLQIPDRYADYIELDRESSGEGEGNPDPEPTGKPDKPESEKTPTVKAEGDGEPDAQSKPDGEKPEERRKPGWLRKIERQRAKIAQLESQLAQMKAKPAKPEQKLTRDHFLSDDEFESWKDAQRTERIKNDMRIEQTENQINDLTADVDDTEFRGSWQERLQDNFEGDQEGLRDYTQKLQGLPHNYLRQEIHEMIRYSEVGPRMLQVLATYPEIANRLNAIKSPVVLGAQLGQLEGQVRARLEAVRQHQPQAPAANAAPGRPQPARKPAAPPPTGPVGGQQGAGDSVDDEDALYASLMNKKFGRSPR